MSRFFSLYFYSFISLLFIIIYIAEIDRASTPFSPILMLMYTIPGVSIIDFLAISQPLSERDRHHFRTFPDLLRI